MFLMFIIIEKYEQLFVIRMFVVIFMFLVFEWQGLTRLLHWTAKAQFGMADLTPIAPT